jgi:hypothetical protein
MVGDICAQLRKHKKKCQEMYLGIGYYSMLASWLGEHIWSGRGMAVGIRERVIRMIFKYNRTSACFIES